MQDDQYDDEQGEPLPSTKPYLLRALYEWCCDNGFTPYLAVAVDRRSRVPMEFVRDGQIVLNISPDATNRLQMGNDLVTFQARFGGQARDISVAVECVAAIYARENGAGMAFEVDELDDQNAGQGQDAPAVAQDVEPEPPANPPAKPGRPHLQRIK
ncbi:ClpXP protease specificity-enhancing factor [Oryzomicrobium terrae]|uniref:ClpXP protease specificity-enhancing factor n=1 Tax=Oryzomicrobium terrae TaxID=1735038 RepID=A0A5C1E721_9RHOO|nr:ClpXP protease specificity-enhancing factor [Oryzomicrobium terrae]QEL64434.1 ClpXP protease specificity-enhancing factor [Oryzomicrobium terrae]